MVTKVVGQVDKISVNTKQTKTMIFRRVKCCFRRTAEQCPDSTLKLDLPLNANTLYDCTTLEICLGP